MSRFDVESHTINIHGGTGGNGGTGGVSGGTGGEGEGPRTFLRYDITAESFTLTNNLARSTIEQPKHDFRFVNLGDLILYDEIDNQHVVEHRPIYRKRTGAVIRNVELVVGTQRVYHARIYKCQDPMTVVVYNDSKFEQRKAEVLEAQRYRHPFLAQLFGFTCAAGLSALIHHDDVLTISQIRKMHAQSTLASKYVEFEMLQHFSAAQVYWEEITGESFNHLPGTAWIRLSTGKLCLDVGNGATSCINIRAGLGGHKPSELPSFKLTENELHDKLLRGLELDEFHAILAGSTQTSLPYNLPSSTEAITLPSIWIPSDSVDLKSYQLSKNPFPDHFTPNDIYMLPWNSYPFQNEEMPVMVLPNGWTRAELPDNPDKDWYHLEMTVQLHGREGDNHTKGWVSQLNYVRKHLRSVIAGDIPLHFINTIWFHCFLDTRLDGFTLRGTFMTDAPSEKVYLFLFPPQVEILDGRLTVAYPPDTERYYWAFDPEGLDRLTHAAAEDIGIPTPQFWIVPWGSWLDEEETNVIREFHAAKGFDPDSQEAAIAIGSPLVDIEAMKNSARKLTGHGYMGCQNEEVGDEIYYSLVLC